MFDIGFIELLVIAVVSLLVIGPQRMPEAIRTGAMWLGRAKRTYSNLRRDLEQEIGADEIRQDLHNEAVMAELRRTNEELQRAHTEMSQALEGREPEQTNSPQQTPLNSTDSNRQDGEPTAPNKKPDSTNE